MLLDVGVAYETDIDRAIELLHGVLERFQARDDVRESVQRTAFWPRMHSSPSRTALSKPRPQVPVSSCNPADPFATNKSSKQPTPWVSRWSSRAVDCSDTERALPSPRTIPTPPAGGVWGTLTTST